MKQMDELLCKILWGQLQSIGWFTEKDSVLTELKAKTGLCDLYDKWLEESIAVLVRMKYLNYSGGSYSAVDAALLNMDEVWQEWERQKSRWVEDPDLKARVILVDATLRALPDILTGKRLAT